MENTNEFTRDILPDLIHTNDYSLYYVVFKNNTQKYKVLSGYKKQLLFILLFYKNKFLNESILLKTQKKCILGCTSNKRQSTNVESPNNTPSESKKQCLEVMNADLTAEKALILKTITQLVKCYVPLLYNNEEI